MEEIWEYVENCSKYAVSTFGSVRSFGVKYKGKLLKPRNTIKGYQQVHLSHGMRQVHRLVAIHFIPNPENKPQVNHIDGNKKNNHVSNLEWCTNQENAIHASKAGLRASKSGILNGSAKLKESDVLEIFYHVGHRFEMMDKFKIGRGVYYGIREKRTWKHLTKEL